MKGLSCSLKLYTGMIGLYKQLYELLASNNITVEISFFTGPN